MTEAAPLPVSVAPQTVRLPGAVHHVCAAIDGITKLQRSISNDSHDLTRLAPDDDVARRCEQVQPGRAPMSPTPRTADSSRASLGSSDGKARLLAPAESVPSDLRNEQCSSHGVNNATANGAASAREAGDALTRQSTALEEPASKKSRLVWDSALHAKFLRSIESIGLRHAVPKLITTHMNTPHLTRENIASHLQKYRQLLRRKAGLPVDGVLDDEGWSRLEAANAAHLRSLQSSPDHDPSLAQPATPLQSAPPLAHVRPLQQQQQPPAPLQQPASTPHHSKPKAMQRAAATARPAKHTHNNCGMPAKTSSLPPLRVGAQPRRESGTFSCSADGLVHTAAAVAQFCSNIGLPLGLLPPLPDESGVAVGVPLPFHMLPAVMRANNDDAVAAAALASRRPSTETAAAATQHQLPTERLKLPADPCALLPNTFSVPAMRGLAARRASESISHTDARAPRGTLPPIMHDTAPGDRHGLCTVDVLHPSSAAAVINGGAAHVRTVQMQVPRMMVMLSMAAHEADRADGGTAGAAAGHRTVVRAEVAQADSSMSAAGGNDVSTLRADAQSSGGRGVKRQRANGICPAPQVQGATRKSARRGTPPRRGGAAGAAAPAASGRNGSLPRDTSLDGNDVYASRSKGAATALDTLAEVAMRYGSS